MRKSISGSRILILGIAYKRDSSDPRLSPALPIIDKLRDLGGIVSVADPHVRAGDVVASDVRCVDATVHEVRSSDAVVLLTNHSSFDLDALTAPARYFLDTRHCTAGPNVEYL
jgi:UDP-N-acetyl-D-glucosamine dehydrogenase